MKTEAELREATATRFYAIYAEWREFAVAAAQVEADKINQITPQETQ